MADPFSVIAGLVGISQAVYQVVDSLKCVSESASDANDDITLLSSELEDIRLLTEYLRQKVPEIERINPVAAQSGYKTVQRCVERLYPIIDRIQRTLRECGLCLDHGSGSHQAFTSPWEKYKWHRKRSLLREQRQDLEGIKTDLNTVLHFYSIERSRVSLREAAPRAFDEQSDAQSQRSETYFDWSQQQPSSEQQGPPPDYDDAQCDNSAQEIRSNWANEESQGEFSDGFDDFSDPSAEPDDHGDMPCPGFTPDQYPQDFDDRESLALDVEYLESLLAVFPWPPPEWDTLDLPDEDFAWLLQFDFTDGLTVLRFSAHLRQAERHHEANHKLLKCRKLLECGKSGIRLWIRRRYWWHIGESSLKHGHPAVRMGEFEYTPLEQALCSALRWHNAVRTHMYQEIGYLMTRVVFPRLWMYICGDRPVEA